LGVKTKEGEGRDTNQELLHDEGPIMSSENGGPSGSRERLGIEGGKRRSWEKKEERKSEIQG